MATGFVAVPTGVHKADGSADQKHNTVILPIPPQNGGTARWGTVEVFAKSDLGDVVLRVAVKNYGAGKGWTVSTVTVHASADRVTVAHGDLDGAVSVLRVGGDADAPVVVGYEATLKA